MRSLLIFWINNTSIKFRDCIIFFLDMESIYNIYCWHFIGKDLIILLRLLNAMEIYNVLRL